LGEEEIAKEKSSSVTAVAVFINRSAPSKEQEERHRGYAGEQQCGRNAPE
jgi:hypothetical protein